MLRFLWIHSTNVKGLALVSQNRLRLFIILGIESSKPRRKNVEPAPHNFCWLPPFLLGFFFFFCSFLWVIVGSNWQEFVGNYSSSSLHTHLLSPQAMNNDWVCKNVVAKNSHQILIRPGKNLHIIVTLSVLIKHNSKYNPEKKNIVWRPTKIIRWRSFTSITFLHFSGIKFHVCCLK